MPHTRIRISGFVLAIVCLTLTGWQSVYADCQQHATQAKLLLTNFKQSALKNQHPDSEKFKSQFEPLMNAMQQENCMNELMKIFQFVQAEQQLYPAPGGMPPGIDD